jgi:MFS family permease
MIPEFNASALKDARWYQFVLRFVLGGAVTAATGLVAQHWGPLVGGLFLSFPAIFPASATLIARHETEKKQKAGIKCVRRGRKAAALDAAGAVLGGFGLVCFGLMAWRMLPGIAALAALALAALVWVLVAVALWWLRRLARRPRPARRRRSQ